MPSRKATTIAPEDLPGSRLDAAKMPGHWLLARIGKRVLRPGGVELTRKLLDGLAVDSTDQVVELAPGLGLTTRMILAHHPARYVGVERDPAAVRLVSRLLPSDHAVVQQGDASRTGQPDQSATVVLGEAVLTMQSDLQKAAIISEVHRILKPGGRYAIHEMALFPDQIHEAEQSEIRQALSRSIHVGARPLTGADWESMLTRQGFEVVSLATAPMHLLELRRLIADEGILGTLRIACNLMRDSVARKRILEMRKQFRRYLPQLRAIALVVRKPGSL